MPRAFVGIVSNNAEARRDFRARLQQSLGWNGAGVTIDRLGPLLIASRGLARRPVGAGSSLILGRIASADGVAADALDALADGGAQRLIRDFWGGYVAAFASPEGRIELLRAPLGDLPCCFQRRGGDLLVASSPRLLGPLAVRPARVGRDALIRHLAFAHLRLPETCLEGVEELPGGHCLIVQDGSVRRDMLWSPWPWTRRTMASTDPEEAAARLFDTARMCIAGSVPSPGGVLLKLSGGLDSSIVAACLADAGLPFRALTLVSDDPAGDERRYARIVARHFGVDLIEARRDPEQVDLSCSPARDLARPSIPLFRQQSERVAAEAARGAGLSLLMDGGGGDNVFCSLQSASPVADCLLSRAGWRHLAATASSVAELAQVSIGQVLLAALRRAAQPRRRYRWPLERSFLSEQALEGLRAAPQHPWLRAPLGILPGRAAHVALIAAGQSYAEGLDLDREPPLAVPLLAQPLVELCLRVPSWQWFDGGLNRAAARRAFGDRLPAAIACRRSKGTPDSFVAQVFERNRTRIHNDLLGGALDDLEIVDRPALQRVLGSRRPLEDRHLQRIMTLYDAEIWSRAWTA